MDLLWIRIQCPIQYGLWTIYGTQPNSRVQQQPIIVVVGRAQIPCPSHCPQQGLDLVKEQFVIIIVIISSSSSVVWWWWLYLLF